MPPTHQGKLAAASPHASLDSKGARFGRKDKYLSGGSSNGAKRDGSSGSVRSLRGGCGEIDRCQALVDASPDSGEVRARRQGGGGEGAGETEGGGREDGGRREGGRQGEEIEGCKELLVKAGRRAGR